MSDPIPMDMEEMAKPDPRDTALRNALAALEALAHRTNCAYLRWFVEGRDKELGYSHCKSPACDCPRAAAIAEIKEILK